MNEHNYQVLSKVIGSVETGGQIYGNARYDAYVPPYTNTPREHTITLGWAQNYGSSAEKLIHMIYDKDRSTFNRLDTATPSIGSMLGKDWAGMRWNPNASQKKALIALIDSPIGHDCQDELFAEDMKRFVSDCEIKYTKDVKAVMMYCEIRHLGGKLPTERIFDRCIGNYSVDSIMNSLQKDQNDTSNSNQVGDKKYWSRHVKCAEFVNKYARQESIVAKKEVKPVGFKKYNLTESQLKKIARLCQQEQGTVNGAKAEASLMANQLETSKSRQNKYGTGADGLYNWVRNGKWYSRAVHWMDNGELASSILEGVRDVLVNGNRTLPQYVDEHDCLSDIKSISTGNVRDKSAYIKGKTIVKNSYGSTWTFYCFPDSHSDPFGYTSEAYKYVSSNDGTEQKKEVVNTATPLQRAKILLRQPHGSVMTGYTPQGKAYFVDAGAWYTTPQKGDVIYFYSTDKGRVGHTGIVEKVDSISKMVYTVEGNTRSDAYAENGGCVARHSYSYKKTGGTNRVNGFGRPNFSGAGVTADEFVDMAISYLGYMEKKSNSQLDSKTANVGSNNYQKFQRDVGAGNGDQWCQYFVDGVALYTCQRNSNSIPDPLITKSYLQQGDSGSAVKTMQTMLIACGYSCGKSGADGDFGENTLTAVKAFQKASGLAVDGLYGTKSKAALEAAYKALTAKKETAVSTSSTNVFLAAVKSVAVTARKNGWTYGDSHATPPCSDKIISCDRLEARALYDLGYTDQRQGGETCGTFPTWLPAHGWKKVTKKSEIKPGAIVAVKAKTQSHINHVFTVVSYDAKTDRCTKYDTGSNERIKTVQPFKNVALVEWPEREFVCAWNVPDDLKGATPKKEEREISGTTFNGVNYQPVYNYNYYKNKYADLRKAFGTDKNAYFKHFCEHGMKEGRQAASAFNVTNYKKRYADLRKAFGDNLPEYYKHYCLYGKKENRSAK